MSTVGRGVGDSECSVILSRSLLGYFGKGRELAERSVRRINPPTVDIGTYSFGESSGGGGILGRGDIGALFKVLVEPGMPLSEVNLWNMDKLVGLTNVEF